MVLHWERCGRVGRRRTNIEQKSPILPARMGLFCMSGCFSASVAEPRFPVLVGSGQTARARESAKRPCVVGPPLRRGRSRRAPARPRRPRGGTSRRSRCASPRPRSSRGRRSRSGDPDGDRAPWPAAASRSTRARRPRARRGRSPRAVEVGAELAVEHGQDVAVELRGHPGRVVVGADQDLGVLDQVGAEQQPLARARGPARTAARNEARSAGQKLPIVPPRNATRRGACRRASGRGAR